MAALNNNRDKMNIPVSLWKTFVFALIYLFFQFVAWGFDLKNRIRFFRFCKYKKFSTQELKDTLSDYIIFVSCEDPLIENFLKKHPQLKPLSAMWIHMPTWQKKFKKELKRRGENVA
jgi:hypothetical protein